MRRKQTTLLVTLVMVSGLLLMSQMPAISPVENTHPSDTTGEGPPVTDTDGDGIPDVHENLFNTWLNWTAVDGRAVNVEGLDRNISSDAELDRDRDGLNSSEEYCWPYTYAACYGNLRSGLTGKLDVSTGLREYLDPRTADTDGDGLPDGFEAAMCARTNGALDLESGIYSCTNFDPLNGSDGGLDIDNDGFDVDRNGILAVHETLSSAEEYIYGAPDNWTAELDGLRCVFTPPELPNITHWPSIGESWINLGDACTDNASSPYGENLWLGTDPTNPDSDRYYFDGYSTRQTWPLTGDGIPDGWEIHFQMDPHNRSDRLEDPDIDGWDLNRDGIISADASPSPIDLNLGESFSTLQEYLVFEDNGNTVRAGLKTVGLESTGGSLYEYPHYLSPEGGGVASILHMDVKELELDGTGEQLYVGTRLGISVITLEDDSSQQHYLPSGMIINDILLLELSNSDVLVIATNEGVILAKLDLEGQLVLPQYWTFASDVEVLILTELLIDAANTHILGLGQDGEAIVVEVTTSGGLGALHQASSDLSTPLVELNATPQDMVHVQFESESPRLYVATDAGLLVCPSASLRDVFACQWRFSFIDDSELRLKPIGDAEASDVRTVVADGPGGQDHILWLGTGSGVHKLDLATDVIEHSFNMEWYGIENNSVDEANDVYSILPVDGEVFIGSAGGVWSIIGGYASVYGPSNQERIPGEIQTMALVDIGESSLLFAGLNPGQFSNTRLIDPGNNDSDFDGIPDGWEYVYGLDPTDPYDAILDADGDGVNLDVAQDPYLERPWTNLDEYRFLPTTPEGYEGTDPRQKDTDMDGISDGAEVFGFFFEETNLWCHYLPNMTYICDSPTGANANLTYLNGNANDQPLDPTNPDSDGDGMPDGWEIEHRRWVGLTFNGGNNWTLDPHRAEDAGWDADGDGLLNLYEYEWSLILEEARNGELIESHGEMPSYADDWFATDPNNPDSDGDTLPDGWEARYLRDWPMAYVGINPMNGSDWLNNPDNDGYDINHDGVLSIEESLPNWLEFHMRDGLYNENLSMGTPLPEGLTTNLWDNVLEWGVPETPYGAEASQILTNGQSSADRGSGNPVDADSDDDGMPDGWEIWFSRWAVLEDGWTLNPLNNTDFGDDPDEDGMTNWEEYNAIDPTYSETNSNQSSPQWFVTVVGTTHLLNSWTRISTDESFGSFISEEQVNLSGRTADPNNPDTDGDGIIDGIEMLFTTWNETAEVWTLNPLVSGDGAFDSDNDALTDAQEFSIQENLPDNGGSNPTDAPLLHEDAEWNQPLKTVIRVHNMLINKEGRQTVVYQDFLEWQAGEPPTAFLSMLMTVTDPTHADTDRDGMIDGYEYWFTEWDLDENRWSMNPLIDNDVYLDSDDDSWDCNQDGVITANETFNNLQEWYSRTYGKESMIGSIPSGMGLVDYGMDAIDASMDETGSSYLEAKASLWLLYTTKDAESISRMNKINEYDVNNYNRSLFGVSDPTHSDSDLDGLPDGWEWCYSIFNMPDQTTLNQWSANPLNPLDVDYDGDHDGWYERTGFDLPASQGTWEERVFTEEGLQIAPGIGDLPFTNQMEFANATRPDLNDSDGDSTAMRREGTGQTTTLYELDWNLSDGREVFKYGSNPKDNDSDGDMLPDWYEYARGWNEANDNYSTWMQIEVWWDDTNPCPSALYYNGATGDIERARLNFTWFNLDPRNPNDANEDPDMDGTWDCSGVATYKPYSNFQEFYAINDQSLTSPSAVRLSGISWQGTPVTEWWQFRGWTLQLDDINVHLTNYLRMYKRDPSDTLWALIIDDQDTDFQTIDPSNDIDLCRGDWTDSWDIYYSASPNSPPSLVVGEREFGWWYLDIDGDHIAEGTDPTKWDTDGDWLHDGWEVAEDEVDGIRGDSSPIHYDSRETSVP